MDPEQLIGSILRGALGARRKRHRSTLGFLLGGRRSSWLNASTVMAAAGVAWGLYETMSRGETVTAAADTPRAAASAPPAGVPPIPPVPQAAAAETPDVHAPEGLPAAVLRVIRLTISAARADGALSPSEEAAIVQHAKTVGAEALVTEELRQPTPLADIVAGTEPAQRSDLYTLAYAIVRADQEVSGAERIYLAQLAHQLGLEPADVAALESSAAERIAQEGA
jgi:uncharacterized membrane protein YebE (DUF533 family)